MHSGRFDTESAGGMSTQDAPHPELTCHLKVDEGVMHLLPTKQPQEAGILQTIFHPNGKGGMTIWGGEYAALYAGVTGTSGEPGAPAYGDGFNEPMRPAGPPVDPSGNQPQWSGGILSIGQNATSHFGKGGSDGMRGFAFEHDLNLGPIGGAISYSLLDNGQQVLSSGNYGYVTLEWGCRCLHKLRLYRLEWVMLRVNIPFNLFRNGSLTPVRTVVVLKTPRSTYAVPESEELSEKLDAA